MNDCVRLAVEEAVRSYGDSGIFNAAGFSNALMRLAGLKGEADGRLCRVILSGRTDVQVLSGSHFRLICEED